MKTRVSESRLRERDWWWTWPSPDRKYDPEFHVIEALNTVGRNWKAQIERAARRYELMRRADRKLEATPFPRLKKDEFETVLEVFGGVPDPAVMLLPDPGLLPAAEGGEQAAADVTDFFDLHLLVRWNASQAEAEKKIAELLKARKAVLGLNKRRRSGEGGRGNNPSWLWPEILDLEHHGRKHFNRSEQQILRNAHAFAAECMSAWRDFLLQ
jgi:hypothetical protein